MRPNKKKSRQIATHKVPKGKGFVSLIYLSLIVIITDLGMPNILNRDFAKRRDYLFFDKPRIEDASTFKFYMLRFPSDLTTNPKETSVPGKS